MGLSDKELSSLQYELTITPKIGDVIKGTGGLRKFRYALKQRKSGSVRVCYIDFVVKERIYLITAYPKNKKENLSKEECNEIKNWLNYWKKVYKEVYLWDFMIALQKV